MPTGYTAAIEKGISLRDFALSCARNFLSCDDSSSKTLEVQAYYVDSLREAEEELRNLQALSPQQLEETWAKLIEQERKEWMKRKVENEVLRSKYEAMQKAVSAWEVGTELLALKNFMLQQIQESIHWDCSDLPFPKVFSSAATWYETALHEAEANVQYRRKKLENQQQAVDTKNAWLKALWAALPEETK